MMAESLDKLNMAENRECRRMLDSQTDSKDNSETVLYSNQVIKINRRGKEQTRTLLITNKAVYNCKPKSVTKVQRKIPLTELASVTLSNVSGEFVLHVPREYDYRYKSNDCKNIAKALKLSYAKIIKGKVLPVQEVDDEELLNQTVTKVQVRHMSHEEREKRIRQQQELMNKGMPSHEDDDEEKHEGNVVNMLDTAATKVGPDDFAFLKVIGRGAFGKVMQVKHKSTGNVYAMKILKKKQLVESNQVVHTKSERKILQALQHPFLMKLRFAFQTDSKLYFVLDFYRGGELFFHLKNVRKFSEEQTQFFIAEVALALGHLHSKDIIYRDLKPENILLHQSGHICLTDFGLSKDLDPMNLESHTFCGTPEYLAPEILQKQGHGKAVDWWSLGILCFELATGQPPFYHNNLHTMYRKIRTETPRFPMYMNSLCKDFISKLLIRDPKRRLGSGDGDVEDLQKDPWFKNMNWDDLVQLKVEPPFVPKVDDAMDTSCFSKEFTREPVQETFVEAVEMAPEDAFNNFTYKPGMPKISENGVGTEV